jgi:hypothetical protein
MVLIMKKICVLLFLAISLPSYSGEIYKWTDEKGTVHFGSSPPTGRKSEVISSTKKPTTHSGSISDAASTGIDQNFLIGRWKSESYSAFGTVIPAQVYVFHRSSQGVEGKATTLPVKSYKVKGNVILVEGAVNQEFTVIDRNTVTFDTGGAGVKQLRRL